MNDHDAIRRLLADYCFGTDTGDIERWVGTFTDDIVWEGGAFGRFEGKEAARAYSKATGDAPKYMRHINSNALIDIEGDAASVNSYIQVYDQSGETPSLIFSGFYRDKLVKQNGQWLISFRALLPDSSMLSRVGEPAVPVGS